MAGAGRMTLVDHLSLAVARSLGCEDDPYLLDADCLTQGGDVLLTVGARVDGRRGGAVRYYAYFENRRDAATTLELVFVPLGADEVTFEVPVGPREVGLAWAAGGLPTGVEMLSYRTLARAQRTGGRTRRHRRGAPLPWRGQPDPWDPTTRPLVDDGPIMNDPAPGSRGHLSIWVPGASVEQSRRQFLTAAAITHHHTEFYQLPEALRQDPATWPYLRRWALGLPALIGDPHDEWPVPLHTGCPAGARAGMEEWWGVTDLESARETLRTLLTGRHGPLFVQLCAQAEAMGSRALSDPNPRVRFVASLGGDVPPQGALAWDLGRVVSLTRSTYSAGYMEEAEAWRWIEEAGEKARTAFGSWREWGPSWVVGHRFWSAGSEDEDTALQSRLDLLLRDPSSRWNRTPWRGGRVVPT